MAGDAVIFADGDEAITRDIMNEVGEAQLAFGSDWLRGLARLEPPKPLVGVVGEVHAAAGGCERAAAIFVNRRTTAERGGQDVANISVGLAADDDVAALLFGPRFD